MWRGRSDKEERPDGAGLDGVSAPRDAPGSVAGAAAVPSQAGGQLPGVADSARDKVTRTPLESGYAVDGIDLPDPSGRSVRRLNLPPLNQAGGTTPTGVAGGVPMAANPQASNSPASNSPASNSPVETPPSPPADTALSGGAVTGAAQPSSGDLGVFGGGNGLPSTVASPPTGAGASPNLQSNPAPTDQPEFGNGSASTVSDHNQRPDYRSHQSGPPNYATETHTAGRLDDPRFDDPATSGWPAADPAFDGVPAAQPASTGVASPGLGQPGLPPEGLAQPATGQPGSYQQAFGQAGLTETAMGQPGLDQMGAAMPQGQSVGFEQAAAPGAPGTEAPKLRLASARSAATPTKKGSGSWLLGAGIGLLFLGGLVGAYFLTKTSGGADSATPTESETSEVAETTEDTVAATTSTTAPAPAAAEASPTGDPLLRLTEAEAGPLDAAIPYPIEILSALPGARYQVVVDELPQGEPFDVLPELHLPPGHHEIYVEMIVGDTTTPTNLIDVHVFDGTAPAAGYRANLASINIETEGWAEANRRFNEYHFGGHEALRLTPSDPYPSLVPGYWNIYVDGFADTAAAKAYCESKGLSVPDECFPKKFDPDAPAP